MQPLTDRERTVAYLVSEGLSTVQIAQQLGISAQTVKNHRSVIYRKLGVPNAAGMTRVLLTTTLVRQRADPFRADVLRGERSPLEGEVT